MSQDNYSRTAWCIKHNDRGDPIRVIYYGDLPITDLSVFNYVKNTPVVLAPISKTSTLVLSEYLTERDKRGLKIHDLRLLEDQIVSSFTFVFKGDEFKIAKLKLDLVRSADSERCVGVSFFLRKLFNHGFNVIMAPKTLKSKTNSTLRAALMVTKFGVDSLNNAEEDEEEEC